jgi:hypothetical protein
VTRRLNSLLGGPLQGGGGEPAGGHQGVADKRHLDARGFEKIFLFLNQMIFSKQKWRRKTIFVALAKDNKVFFKSKLPDL